MLNSTLADGLLGAVIGAIIGAGISGFFVLRQTKTLLSEERLVREEERHFKREEREGETKSLAAALLWEIDDFYKLSIRDVCRSLKEVDPSTLGFQAKPATYKSFRVFESNADKLGLLSPALIQGVIGYYGTARAYLNTMSDYGQTLQAFQGAMQTQIQGKAVELLGQVKRGSLKMVPLTKTVCEALADRAGAEYTFDAP